MPDLLDAQDVSDTSQKKEDLVEHEMRCELSQPNSDEDFFNCILEGPPVPAGSQVRLKLTFVNKSASPILFDRFLLSCNCLDITCVDKEIQPSQEIKANAVFRTPRTKDGKYVLDLSLALGNKKKAYVGISGLLEGTLEILNQAVYESSDVIPTWEIPVMFTKPIKASRLKVSMSKSLRDLDAEIKHADEKVSIVVSAPAASIGPAGVSGDIIIEDPELKVQAAVKVTFAKTPPVRVSPQFCHFKKVAGKESEFEAFVLVQAPKEKDQQSSENEIFSVNCEGEAGFSLKVEGKKINNSLFRIRLVSGPFKSEEMKLLWKIETVKGSFNVEGAGHFYKEE